MGHHDAGKPFAFRDYINGLDKRKGAKPWIFVPRKEDYFEASKPLLALWLECAASAVLGLPPSPGRRMPTPAAGKAIGAGLG